MEFQDRILRCVDCGAEFIWTAGEQQFFADKNFKNEPKRCKACKGKRASRPAGGADGPRTGRNRQPVLGLRQGDDGAVQADAGAPGLLQGMLPVPEIRRGWRRLAPPVLGLTSHRAAVRRRRSPSRGALRARLAEPRHCSRARLVLSSHRIYLERFHADRGTDGRRRDGARPEGQDHAGRGRRAAQGQGQQPRQPGSQEDRAEPRRRPTSTARASAKSSAPTRR